MQEDQQVIKHLLVIQFLQVVIGNKTELHHHKKGQ